MFRNRAMDWRWPVVGAILGLILALCCRIPSSEHDGDVASSAPEYESMRTGK